MYDCQRSVSQMEASRRISQATCSTDSRTRWAHLAGRDVFSIIDMRLGLPRTRTLASHLALWEFRKRMGVLLTDEL